MPKGPKGKRVPTVAGEFAVVSKNANQDGSVYFDQPFQRTDGTMAKGRWRATYRDAEGHLRRVSAPTRAVVEQRRAEALELIASVHPHVKSRFTPATTVGELADWWLHSVARHQVRESSLHTYRKVAAHLVDDFGNRRVRDVGAESLTVWQSTLLDRYSAYTVLNSRKVGRQIFAEAVKFGLVAFNPFDLVKAPRARPRTTGRALAIDDARELVAAAGDVHLGVAVALLFCQGWRVSEVLGLAWEDLDFKAGTARIERAATHLSGRGVSLGPTKTDGVQGVHHLAPVTIAGLKARRLEQNAERLAFTTEWPEHRYDGQLIRPIFTNSSGALVNR
jgi:integrase